MAKKVICILCLILILSGCSVVKNSNTLSGFCERMNDFYKAEDFSVNGYCINEDKSTFAKFYVIDNNEILIEFSFNEDKNLTSMTLSLENNSVKNEKVIQFIKYSISAFTFNNETAGKYINKKAFKNLFSEKTLETKKEELDNCQLLVDVTELGTVLTIIRNYSE